MNCTLFIWPIIILLSCNRYIDAENKKVQILDGSFISSTDSNTLIYRTSVGLRMDDIVVKPKPFQVKLPKKMRYYELIGPSDFAFYYSQRQVVFIRIDLENRLSLSDTSYTPSESELKTFIQQSSTGNHNKYDIKQLEVKARRNNKLIRKGDASILLYNILEENDKLFTDYLNSFHFLGQ